MLTSAERERLGLDVVRAARRPSAMSQALRAIRDEVENGPAAWLLDGEACAPDGPELRMRVAFDRATRERAYALAYRVYRSCDYADADRTARCVSAFDAQPETLTLLVEDDLGRDAATITLVFDSLAGLPCDELYRAEVAPLRASSRKLVEVTRLAIGEEYAARKPLLVRLFNFIYIFARRVRGCDDFVIEVNPRHASFYRRLLGFEPLGAERPCHRVKDAPAVLLRLNLAHAESEVRRVGGLGAAADERSLYPWFYTWLEEGAIAEFLARQHRPMTEREARYFGLPSDPQVARDFSTASA